MKGCNRKGVIQGNGDVLYKVRVIYNRMGAIRWKGVLQRKSAVQRKGAIQWKFIEWMVLVHVGGHVLYMLVAMFCTCWWPCFVPVGGHVLYLLVAMFCTCWWPCFVPVGGHVL